MRDLIRELGRDRTIILSSHILPEVEQVCGKLIIISGGKIVAQGSPADLRKRVTGASRLIAEAKGGKPEEMAKVVAEIEAVTDVQPSRAGNWTRLTIKGSEQQDLRPAVASALVASGYQIRELRREVGSLEEFFVQITYEQSVGAGAGEDAAAS